jgi:pSer/pThr/pTyr-binding forkhead associated (FHA) protein
MVSRRHCQLTLNKDSAKLRDLGSRAGTFINGKQVAPEQDVSVKAGDYITIGPLTFVCQIDGKPAKIVPPPKGDAKGGASRSGSQAAPSAAKAKPKPRKAPATVPDDDLGSKIEAELDDSDGKLDDDLSDLDVSDSFINLDELDADLEDLKDA